MRILLDTHALLWMLDDDPRLSAAARELIEDPGHDLFVSMVSLWEIALKVRVGKLEAETGEVIDALAPSGLKTLDLRPSHLVRLIALPRFADHRDPFDHLLIAQAIDEDLHFMSEDRNVMRYPVKHLELAA